MVSLGICRREVEIGSETSDSIIQIGGQCQNQLVEELPIRFQQLSLPNVFDLKAVLAHHMGEEYIRQQIEAEVSEKGPDRRDLLRELYTYAELTPFEQIAVFGWENSFVSHDALANKSALRAGVLAEHFERISTSQYLGETLRHETTERLEEQAKPNQVTEATKAIESEIEWPAVGTKIFVDHYDHRYGGIKLVNFVPQASPTRSRRIEWSQLDRARDVAEDYSQGKVKKGQVDGERVLAQTESLVLNEETFEAAMNEIPFDIMDNPISIDPVVEKLKLDRETIESFSYRGRKLDPEGISQIDFYPNFTRDQD